MREASFSEKLGHLVTEIALISPKDSLDLSAR
jgi:hypothetical protein